MNKVVLGKPNHKAKALRNPGWCSQSFCRTFSRKTAELGAHSGLLARKRVEHSNILRLRPLGVHEMISKQVKNSRNVGRELVSCRRLLYRFSGFVLCLLGCRRSTTDQGKEPKCHPCGPRLCCVNSEALCAGNWHFRV